jgi:hypothetical protein
LSVDKGDSRADLSKPSKPFISAVKLKIAKFNPSKNHFLSNGENHYFYALKIKIPGSGLHL